MAIIHMGQIDGNGDVSKIPVGAYTPFSWRNDVPVMDGNSDVPMRTTRGAMFLYETHHGLCLSEREMNGRDDSDFYMLVWDEAAQAPHEIMFATTRGWSYPCLGSSVDATPETIAKYAAWEQHEIERRKAALAKAHALAEIQNLASAHKGATVRVARGRKVPKGTAGKVLNVSTQQGYTGEPERWALIDTGVAFVKVLARHLEVLRPDPSAVQTVFDMTC